MKPGLFIALFVQFLFTAVLFAEEILPDYIGRPFYSPNLSVEWRLPANSLPATVRIFKIVDGSISPTAITNLMRLGGFSETDRVRTDYRGNKIPAIATCFRNFNDRHSLTIVPTSGTVFLYAPDFSTAMPEGVPDRDRGFDLATNILKRLEIPTGQLIRTNGQLKAWCYPGEMTMYPKGAEPITRRSDMGIEFRRMLDGIPCRSEDVHIDFERNEKITQLQIRWHGVKPSKPYPVASFEKMAHWIKEGRARVTDLEGPSGVRLLQPAGIKKITITGISFYYTASSYFSEPPDSEIQMSQMYPYAMLKADAEISPDDHEAIWLFCPVTKSALMSVSRKSDQFGFGIYPSNLEEKRMHSAN